MARMYGVYRGTVLDDVDPAGAGRLLVAAPGAFVRGAWAVVAGLPAATGAAVIVAFEGGDPARPVVLGGLAGPGGTWALPGGASLRLDPAAHELALDDGQGASVTFSPAGCRLTVPSAVTVETGQLHVSAGTVEIDAGMVRASGVVQATTVITDTIVAATYTPGAGNVW